MIEHTASPFISGGAMDFGSFFRAFFVTVIIAGAFVVAFMR